MYVCLNCSSPNVVPFETEYPTGVGSERWSESGWRCLDCTAFEDRVDWIDDDANAAGSSEAA